MASITSDQRTTSTPYAGPLNHDDPLTDIELTALLAIPRAAEATPDATMCRLPLGTDPTQGWVDVTFAEARSIIARLAADWKTRLSNKTNRNVGPGTTICLLVQPIAHGILHWLAFWALGCSIQAISLSMDDDTIALYLNKSGCQVVIHSGISEARVEGISSGWNGITIKLTDEEHAHQLALSNKQGQIDSTFPWPEPRRPDPAIILHSSGSTGAAKLLKLSLYFCVLGLPSVHKANAARFNIGTTDPRPFLIFSAPYWTSFSTALINQISAGSSVAFAHVSDISKCSSDLFINWARSLDAGATVCVPRFIRDILASGSESSINFLQGMHTITIGGTVLDESTAALAEKYNLKLLNIFGCTELGTLMITNQPPFTHLRPLPRPTPLVVPLTDTDADGSRQVQFWYSPSSSPRVAHIQAKGGIPVQFEPFPGEGPHKGEPAVKLDDIFKEVQTSSEVSYVYLGRSDDLIKLAGREVWGITASAYENELASVIASNLPSQPNENGRWTLDAVQLFSDHRPCTALVVQFSSGDQGEIGKSLLEQLSSLVVRVNSKLNLGPHQRVHPQKRMLIITSEGRAYGSGVQNLGGNVPRLMVTHKHTLQRWKNVEAFRSWMNGLDYSEP